MKSRTLNLASLPVLTLAAVWGQNTPLGLGIFEERGDVGTVLHPGALQYFPANKAYEITGSGENMWAAADAFQFVWKKMSGDVDLSADIAFANAMGDPHKKAVLMIRQSLDADSAYVDVALHNIGLTSLQARETKGAATHEIELQPFPRPNVSAFRSAATTFICSSVGKVSRCIWPVDRSRFRSWELFTSGWACARIIRTSARRPRFQT